MNKQKILIIGGGVAGLTAGIYAQLNGYQATILEMHEKPGGQLTAWEREGYRFDYCLHWLVGSDHGTYHDIWRTTHAITNEVEVTNHKVYLKLVDHEQGEFYVYCDIDRWEAYLLEVAPDDEVAIKRLCRMLRKGDYLDQYENPPSLRSFWDHVRMLWNTGSFLPILLKYGKSNCRELLADLGFQNKRLLHFLWWLFEGEDFSAVGFLVLMGWFHAKNAGYLQGGSAAMSRRMADRFLALGGRFHFRTKVQKVLLEDDVAKGVLLQDGGTLRADHIIGACDGRTILYDMLDGRYLNDQLKDAYTNWPLFKPLVMVSFGVSNDQRLEGHLVNYIVPEQNIGSTSVKTYSLQDHAAYDASFAPLGKKTVQLYFNTNWDLWEHLKGQAYQDEKEAIRKDASLLLEKHYPGISADMEVVEVATPLTTVRYTGVWKGAYEGFMLTTDLTRTLPMQLEGLQNFTMIGQWLTPGGGLPPSAQSGKWAIQLLCEEQGKAFVER